MLRKIKINKFFLIILLFIIFSSILFFGKSESPKGAIEVKLITSVHKDLPFKFKTEQDNLKIVPGEVKTINYTVENLSQETITGMATFQVYPNELRDKITKMNCFCYEAQTLQAGEKEKYALVLTVDPKVTKNVKEAIIQFVFFKK